MSQLHIHAYCDARYINSEGPASSSTGSGFGSLSPSGGTDGTSSELRRILRISLRRARSAKILAFRAGSRWNSVKKPSQQHFFFIHAPLDGPKIIKRHRRV
ncbi:hypothetical protein C2845_PM09G05390 [Panicum miliaceum]|uniref:Uncharacterized protein n=1 Tax=Panicum miliaceum TaxID=4540 RepID=A0A3L6RZ64_PANMI|nr:hypothetical protein C2845_PM09G05390 [Panicum miliaceum]